MAERETEYLFHPYQNHIYIAHGWWEYPQKVKIKDRTRTYEVCRVMVDGNLVHERHNDYSIEATEKNNKKDGKHTGKCRLCGSIQTEPHSWEFKPIWKDNDNHKYLCSKFDTRGNRCEGYYLESHTKIYSQQDSNSKYYGSYHNVDCNVCGKTWLEKHNWEEDSQGNPKWRSLNENEHYQVCTDCWQKKKRNHSNIKYHQILDNGVFDIYTHAAECGVCHGPWLEEHDWQRKSDNSLYWKNDESDSKCKTYHKVKCRKCEGFKYERHNYGSTTYKKGGYAFKSKYKCVCGKIDSIDRWSIAYKNVPCGNGKTMNIQLKYNGKNKDSHLYLKILPDDQGNDPDYPIVYTGDLKRPNPEDKNEKPPIHVKNGWYKRSNGKGWTSGSKKYTYKKHFVIEGVKESENQGILYEGEHYKGCYKGYRLISDYVGYESSGSTPTANSKFLLKDIKANRHRFSTSKTKVTNEEAGGVSAMYYFYSGGFSGFWFNSDKPYEEPYMLFPCVLGWHKSKASLVSGSYIVTG